MQRRQALHPNRHDPYSAGAHADAASSNTYSDADIDASGNTDSYAGAHADAASSNTYSDADIDASGNTDSYAGAHADAMSVRNRNPAS